MAQRDLDGPPLEPGDLTGDDPSISETPRAGVEEANKSPAGFSVGPHEGKEGDESSKISVAMVTPEGTPMDVVGYEG